MKLESFIEDDKTSSAVIRKFEVMGEAVKNIPDSVKEIYPDIPWKRIAGMRDRLIHAYFGIDYNIVWNAIKIEIPEIKFKFEKMLHELKK